MVARESHEISCEIACEGFRWQYPNASEAEIENLLTDRLKLARGE